MSQDHDPVTPGARPSARTLRFDSFSARFERLCAAAEQRGIATDDLVLPAEGIVLSDDDVRVHYLEWPGHSAAPTVLFLHGGGLHAHTFDLVGALLRRKARCIAIDLRGHGDSDWAQPGQYGSEAMVADISAVVVALDLKDVVLVGHSMGGMGALAWAARRPEALTGLIVLDVAPAMDDAAAASVNDFIVINPAFGDLEEVDGFVTAAFPSSTSGANGIVANLRWSDEGRLVFKYDSDQFHPENITLALGDELRAIARRIHCPARILRGSRSKVLSVAAARELAGLIPNATWTEVPDSGHTIQSSNPVGLATEIATFLDGVAVPDATGDRGRR